MLCICLNLRGGFQDPAIGSVSYRCVVNVQVHPPPFPLPLRSLSYQQPLTITFSFVCSAPSSRLAMASSLPTKLRLHTIVTHHSNKLPSSSKVSDLYPALDILVTCYYCHLGGHQEVLIVKKSVNLGQLYVCCSVSSFFLLFLSSFFVGAGQR